MTHAPDAGKVFYRFSSKKRPYHLTGLRRQVRAAIPKTVELYVVLNDHRMDTGALPWTFVAGDGLIQLVFTTKNASWWNVV